MLTRLSRISLLILDDWAMIRLTEAQRRDLMDVIDDRDQRASTILASSLWSARRGDGLPTRRSTSPTSPASR